MNNIKIDVNNIENDGVRVVMEGEVTLNNADKIKDEIMNAVNNHASIEVKIHNVTNIDLFCVQLLYSVKKTVNETKKSVLFDVTIPEEFQLLLGNAGFNDLNELNN